MVQSPLGCRSTLQNARLLQFLTRMFCRKVTSISANAADSTLGKSPQNYLLLTRIETELLSMLSASFC